MSFEYPNENDFTPNIHKLSIQRHLGGSILKLPNNFLFTFERSTCFSSRLLKTKYSLNLLRSLIVFCIETNEE